IKALDNLKDSNADIQTGMNILRRALEEPLRRIVFNAGQEGSVVVEEVRRRNSPRLGYDAAKGAYVAMVELGIIDPLKVTRCGLENAASAASMILTTQTLVTDIPESEPPMPMGHSHDMDF